MEYRNFSGQPIFAQIVNLISKDKILSISRKKGGERYVKKLDAHQHLIALLFSVISGFKTLRTALVGLNAEALRLEHVGLTTEIKRSTLSDANNRRPSAVFAEIYRDLFKKIGRFLSDSRDYAWERALYVMDSTTISLFSNVLKGAGRNPKIGRKNGGLKAHTIMKAFSGVPEFIVCTAAAVHDHVMLKMVDLPKDSFIAFDRAYVDIKYAIKFSRRRITYVTKMKKNLTYEPMETVFEEENEEREVRRDEIVEFFRKEKGRELRHRARIVEYVDRKSGTRWRLLTNNFDLPAEEVVEIYRRRWQIETFYRKLKQNFPLHFFYGESANAIETQVWVVMIANLLASVIKAQLKRNWFYSNFVALLRQSLMYYYDMLSFFENPEQVARRSRVGGLSPPTDQLELPL